MKVTTKTVCFGRRITARYLGFFLALPKSVCCDQIHTFIQDGVRHRVEGRRKDRKKSAVLLKTGKKQDKAWFRPRASRHRSAASFGTAGPGAATRNLSGRSKPQDVDGESMRQ
jgi:hypothetical protein